MNELRRKYKTISTFVLIACLVIIGIIVLRAARSDKCLDIIGDGYAMGTDPKPVVIGKNCKQADGSINFVPADRSEFLEIRK